MKTLLSKSYELIPLKSKKRLYVFFFYSFINTILDFISIAYLTPVILLMIDREKLSLLLETQLNIALDNAMIVGLLVSLIVFFILKNLIQAKLVHNQLKYVYGIASALSEKLVNRFIYEKYTSYNKTKKNVLFRDVLQLPLVFATNVLFSFYTVFSELIILLLLILVGCIYAPKITAFSFVILAVLSVLLISFQRKKINFYNKSITDLYQENIKNILNVFYGFVDIKASRAEEQFKSRFTDSNASHNLQLASLQSFRQTNSRYFELLFIVGLSVVMLFYLFFSRNFGDLVILSFFIGSSIKIIPSFNKILSSYIDIRSNRYSVDLLHSYTEGTADVSGTVVFQNTLELRDISFAHQSKQILNAVSLRVEKGDFISISGDSGVGKSTLLHLISGLLKPDGGGLYIDGTLANASETNFNFVGYVSQQPFIFQGSILENITMYRNETVDLGLIAEIVGALGLDDWLDTQPNGIHSELLLESKKLSGGQKQRIALARTLYLKPKILLLDEATNQLDKKLEIKIFQYLKEQVLTNGTCIIAVSHNATVNTFASKKYLIADSQLSLLHE